MSSLDLGIESMQSGHTVLLIGVRIEGDGKVLFLFQNWWEKKQFFNFSKWTVSASCVAKEIDTAAREWMKILGSRHPMTLRRKTCNG